VPEYSGLLVKVFGGSIEIQAISIQLVTLGQMMRGGDKTACLLGQDYIFFQLKGHGSILLC